MGQDAVQPPNSDYGEIISLLQHWDPDVWEYLQINNFLLWYRETGIFQLDSYGEYKDGRVQIVINRKFNSIEAAKEIIKVVRESYWHGCQQDFRETMRTQKNTRNENGYKEYFKAEAEYRSFVIKRMAEAGIGGATVYLSILSVMNSGVDFTVTLAEVLQGNYLVAILRVLPVAANGTVRFIFRRVSSSGKLVEEVVVLNKKQIEALVKGTKVTYKEAKELTEGCKMWIQGHHIVEQWVLKKLGKADVDKIVQILTREEHEAINKALNSAFGQKYGKLTTEQIWAVYQDVYTRLGHPEWLDLIRPYFF
jgi:hypothetical protein